jgi:iron complex transport system permease protein
MLRPDDRRYRNRLLHLWNCHVKGIVMAQTTLKTTDIAAAVPAVRPRASWRRWALVALAVALPCMFLLGLIIGSVNIPLSEVVTILLGGEPARDSWATIVLNFRLPKAITAVLAGSGLAVAGLLMQTLFRNPLADPFVLGISSGASLGVALVLLVVGTTGATLLAGLGLLGDFSLILAASLGAALVLALVLLVAQRVRSTMTLLILGVMFGYTTSSLVSILVHFSIMDRIQTYINWTFGSFGGVTWGQMGLFTGAMFIGQSLAYVSVKPLNALLLGEAYARSMGVNIRRVRLLLIVAAAVLAGAVTAFCGPIGFLGIAVPHLSRALLGTSDHRVLVPACTLMGGSLALIADLIAHVPGSQFVLPLNAITALIGAPVVVWVILRRHNLRETFGT